MTSVNALCWSRCTVAQFRKRRGSEGAAPTVLHPNWGLLGWWRPPRYVESGAAGWLAHTRRCSSDRFQGSQREGSAGTHPPAWHTLADTRSTTAVGSGPPTSASPVRTASGPTIGHSTRPANPRVLATHHRLTQRPLHGVVVHWDLGMLDEQRQAGPVFPQARQRFASRRCRCGSATSTSQRRWKAATARRSWSRCSKASLSSRTASRRLFRWYNSPIAVTQLSPTPVPWASRRPLPRSRGAGASSKTPAGGDRSSPAAVLCRRCSGPR